MFSVCLLTGGYLSGAKSNGGGGGRDGALTYGGPPPKKNQANSKKKIGANFFWGANFFLTPDANPKAGDVGITPLPVTQEDFLVCNVYIASVDTFENKRSINKSIYLGRLQIVSRWLLFAMEALLVGTWETYVRVLMDKSFGNCNQKVWSFGYLIRSIMPDCEVSSISTPRL